MGASIACGFDTNLKIPAQAECPVPRHFVKDVMGLNKELGRGAALGLSDSEI